MNFPDIVDDPEDTLHTASERAEAASRSTWVSVGVNVVLTVQVAPAARLAAQLWVTANGPVTENEPTLRAAMPELDRVTLWVSLEVATAWSPNAKVSGLAKEAGETPAPEIATELLPALLAIVSAPA